MLEDLEGLALFIFFQDKKMYQKYYCKKCKKIFHYPVGHCYDCNSKLAPIKIGKYKKLVETQVEVSSLFHQKTPYKVSLIEDRAGNFYLEKNTDVRKNIKISGKKSTVIIKKAGYDILGTVESCLNLLDIKIPKTGKILLKPNLAVPSAASTGIVTNPFVVEGVVKYLISHKVDRKRIIVAENSVIGFDTIKAAKKSNIWDICKKYKVSFSDFSKEETVRKRVSYGNNKYFFDVFKIVFDSSLLINIPVVKTHFQSGISCALKNMKGVISNPTRKLMHKWSLQETIACLNSILPKYLTVADGTIALEGMGPAALGKPVGWNVVLAGMDPVAIDSIVCKATGLKKPNYIAFSRNLGVGEDKISKIDILGDSIARISRKFESADGNLSPHPDIEIIDGFPCSGCLNALWQVLYKTKNTKGKKAYMAFGTEINLNKKINKDIFCLGDCAIGKLRNNPEVKGVLAGCPPDINEVEKFTLKILTRK